MRLIADRPPHRTSSFLAPLAFLLAIVVACPAHADVLGRKYTASLTAESEQAGDGQRQIELAVFVREGADSTRESIWVETQDDVRQLSWLHRFGRMSGHGNGADATWPTIRFDWGEGVSYVPVILAIDKPTVDLAPAAQWEAGSLTYEVVGQEDLGDVHAWRISVRNNFGEKRTILVEPNRLLIVALRETVVLGQGQKHTLVLELQDSQTLDDAEWEKLIGDYERFDQLRTELGGASEQDDRAWTSDQLAAMKQSLAQMTGHVQTNSFKRLFSFAEAESKFERGRAGAIDEMRRQALSRKLPGFEFEAVVGQRLARGDLENTVAIMHFWDYRDAPLREPYGQVGYLDFLYRKYEQQGVRVLGVVVNQQVETPAQRRGAMTSARKFASFMNLAYPIYVDSGSLLKDIGDPRVCDAPLPLFVVVGRDGQIVHYRAGYYPVEANAGLAELEAAIKLALENGE